MSKLPDAYRLCPEERKMADKTGQDMNFQGYRNRVEEAVSDSSGPPVLYNFFGRKGRHPKGVQE